MTIEITQGTSTVIEISNAGVQGPVGITSIDDASTATDRTWSASKLNTKFTTLTKANVGLGNVDNTADATKAVLSATKLATARTVSLSGDATGSASFDGSANATITTTLANSGVTAGTYKSVTVNAKGLITGGTNPTTLSGYGITDAVESVDIGTAPNQIPLNQYLGNLAYQNTDAIGSPMVVGVQSDSTALRVTQTGNGNALVVEDSANPDATPFVIDSNGRVLSGLTTAYSSLYGNQASVQLVSQHGVSPLAVGRYGANIYGADVDFTKTRHTSPNSHTIVQSGDQLGNLVWSGSDGTAFQGAAAVNAVVDSAPAAGSMPGRLTFGTTPSGSTSPVVRMTINSKGEVGLGVPPSTGVTLSVSKILTGNVNSVSTYSSPTIQADVTNSARSYVSEPYTAASSFTLTQLEHFRATQGTIGAGSAITGQYGFTAASTLIGATNNFGFYGNIPAGAGRYNFYANGTADNYFSGVTTFGSAFGYAVGAGGAVTQTTSRTTGVTINKPAGAITLVSAAGSTAYQTFTVTNSTVSATDTVVVNQKSGTDSYLIFVTNVSAGSFKITFSTTGGTTTEQPVFNFAVVKSNNA